MAYDQGVTSLRSQSPPSGVCDWDIAESDSRLEGEGWYDGDVLIGNQSSERVLRLAGGSGVAGSREHHWAHLPLLSSLNGGK